MPYPMVHMEIAYKVLKKCEWIEQAGDFILGSVAPDAVHFHDPYDVHLKEASHLWDCGPKWGMTTDSKRWKDSIKGFWEEHKSDENRDFMAGYCAHLLADWLYDRRIWSPFCRKLQGEDSDAIYYNEQYRTEAYRFDQCLNQNSPHTEKIWGLLNKGRIYDADGHILSEDLMRQKQSILTEQFAHKIKYDISGYEYCSLEAMSAYMTECVDKTIQMIKV